ncbi:hypothetical protein ASPCAL11518 [Aspergillus calidoustus]|uniref:Uncharacterized protein n=1 Tax=Aspergillus calidoustus TaxID=454130 RepID=A0A0U5GEY1_ASPCI|nr:hypothetical protein ASPCAL11518 [Aspergillus calidoustus]
MIPVAILSSGNVRTCGPSVTEACIRPNIPSQITFLGGGHRDQQFSTALEALKIQLSRLPVILSNQILVSHSSSPCDTPYFGHLKSSLHTEHLSLPLGIRLSFNGSVWGPKVAKSSYTLLQTCQEQNQQATSGGVAQDCLTACGHQKGVKVPLSKPMMQYHATPGLRETIPKHNLELFQRQS